MGKKLPFAEMITSAKGREFLGIVTIAVALLMILSLFSYHPDDPTWFFSSESANAQAENIIGSLGAFIAKTLYQLLGFAAWLIPVLMILLGGNLLLNKELEHMITRLTGFGIMVLAFAAFGSIVKWRLGPIGERQDSGGIIGGLIAGYLESNLNKVGALIVVITLIMLALIITTKFSFQESFLRLKELSLNLFRKIRARFFHKREHKRKTKMREEVIRKHAVKAIETKKEKKKEVKVTPPEPKEPQPHFEFEQTSKRYTLPPLTLLDAVPDKHSIDEKRLVEKGRLLTSKFDEFGINGEVVQIHPGPVVTTFEFKPEAGVKYSRITGLADDLCLALKADSVRIDRISGKSTVGIEVPNEKRDIIYLRDIFEDEIFRTSKSRLTLGLGALIKGDIHVSDLDKMPHLLVAGATGTGKSVAINSMIASILYKATPEDVRFIFIDPKRLELGLYEGIPHLLTPVVVEPKIASNVLKWVVREMETRYRTLAGFGVRNIEQFNYYVTSRKDLILEKLKTMDNGQEAEEEVKPLPYIVVVIDELADLMMVSSKDVEESITRLAQMARAVGIHLILATQRPSVDVITGIIKANFPARISFRVSSKTDSRTILDTNGAERLLGMGDMLFLPPGTSRLKRIHGAFVSEQEITRVVSFLKRQGDPDYDDTVLEPPKTADSGVEMSENDDELYDQAVRLVVRSGKASISSLQRRFSIGYNRAARLIDMMEADDIVGEARGSKPRKVLVDKNYFDEIEDSE